jgi:hypothetical protein
MGLAFAIASIVRAGEEIICKELAVRAGAFRAWDSWFPKSQIRDLGRSN